MTEERRFASDQLLVDLDRLRVLEVQKRSLTPGSDDYVELARAVEELAIEVLGSSVRQKELAEKAAVVLDRVGTPEAAIGDAARRNATDILHDWREAERARAAAVGTAAEATEEARVKQFRDEYQQMVADRSRVR